MFIAMMNIIIIKFYYLQIREYEIKIIIIIIIIIIICMYIQRAKKVMSDSLGLVDFAIGLVNTVFNLPDGQVIFFEQLE